MFGERRRPQAKSVVMLGGENDRAHAGVAKQPDDAVGIQLRWIEERG
jgi:hypothetical protein